MGLSSRLKELDSELRSFECRPKTLVPDLVLVALATDVLESAKAVQDTARTALPHKAYANARVVFEGAQNLLVLATHEAYEVAGARAWVYFELKDAAWRVAAERQKSGEPAFTEDQWLDQRVSQMSTFWNSVAKGQGDLLLEALTAVRSARKKKPDNWLHENMARRHHRAYELFAATIGGRSLADTAEMNQAIFQVLCRETHARPRLESFGVI